MSEFLNYLAIGVTPNGLSAEELAQQAHEEKSRTIWMIVLVILFIAEVFIALFLPKIINKIKVKKKEKAEYKAKRKAVQSKRK
jgi:di/tricarboxylate transporter